MITGDDYGRGKTSGEARTQKGEPGTDAGLALNSKQEVLRLLRAVAATELLNPAGRVKHRLLAGVERVVR
ncbi:hypothetical protein BH23BAC4_BH23BAC4_06250 [soil metagenome]